MPAGQKPKSKVRKAVQRARIVRRRVFGRKVKIDGKKILERISEIWDIPYEKLEPLESHLNSQESVLAATQLLSSQKFKLESAIAQWKGMKRGKDAESLTDAEKMQLTNKERLVGIHNQLFKRRLLYMALAELAPPHSISNLEMQRFGNTFRYLYGLPKKMVLNPIYGGWRTLVTPIRRIPEHIIQRKYAKELARLGNDGIILYCCSDNQKVGFLEFIAWKKKRKKQGMVNEVWKLPEEVMGALKIIRKRKTILTRLEAMLKRLEESNKLPGEETKQGKQLMKTRGFGPNFF